MAQVLSFLQLNQKKLYKTSNPAGPIAFARPFSVKVSVMEDFKIKSFFFVYSSIFKGKPDLLEVYRYFRTNYFSSIDNFYDKFFGTIDKDLNTFFKNNIKIINDTKIKLPF